MNGKTVFLVLCGIFLASVSCADFKFNIDSPKIILEVNPGEKSAGYITVDNYGYGEDLQVKVYVEDLIYLPDGTNDFLPKGSTRWSIADWLKVEPKEFVLNGDSSSRVRYTVSVPPDAVGGRYGVIFFEVRIPGGAGSGNIGSSSAVRMGSILAVSVKGTEDYKAELAGLKTSFKLDGLTASCVIKNAGNVLIRPVGDFSILDRDGKEVLKREINPSNGGILPGTNRTFETKWEGKDIKLDKGGDYILQAIVDYGGKSLLGGQMRFNLKDE